MFHRRGWRKKERKYNEKGKRKKEREKRKEKSKLQNFANEMERNLVSSRCFPIKVTDRSGYPLIQSGKMMDRRGDECERPIDGNVRDRKLSLPVD